MKKIPEYLPQQVNSGRWVTAYTLFELRERLASTRFVLPVCSLGTSYDDLAANVADDELLLPPLFHEAMTDDLRDAMIARIQACFPFFELSSEAAEHSDRLRVEVRDPKPLRRSIVFARATPTWHRPRWPPMDNSSFVD